MNHGLIPEKTQLWGIYHDIIQVSFRVFSYPSKKYILHNVLEVAGGASGPKQHSQWCKLTCFTHKSQFLLITLRHPQVAVGISQIKLCERVGVEQAVHKFHGQRQRVFVLHRDRVQLAVVKTRAQVTVFLTREQDWRGPR